MAIQILPARLANQIAAGEVVERPASVVKELVENSLDAGATQITIDIDKGGAKRIKISDNGCGINKDELTLALSRHATSKINDLSDLEAINSLGFRGEALASISSVARLTLTSKPATQANAWQASAEGRDMSVTVQPAAHPDGTTIDVQDLFFNTPARRKFLRTEKTEFTHIDEVIKRIALSEFGVGFTLIHNGKTIRQYLALNDKTKFIKRISAVCGQRFVDNAIAVECQHDDMLLWGWIGHPEFSRPQNDLCYSYVNGRMMRDKLINHAIRQAYADLLPEGHYPTFVLFLNLAHKEVDVNVHPAKHEVRFHQARYIHDFILSVVQNGLANCAVSQLQDYGQQASLTGNNTVPLQSEPEFITPLQFTSTNQASAVYRTGGANAGYNKQTQVSEQAITNYHHLLSTPKIDSEEVLESSTTQWTLLTVIDASIGVFQFQQQLYCVNLVKMARDINASSLMQRWHEKSISQPLLLPISIRLEKHVLDFISQNQQSFEFAGFVLTIEAKQCQVRQCPAQLRNRDVNQCFVTLVELLMAKVNKGGLVDSDWCQSLAAVMSVKSLDFQEAKLLFDQAKQQKDLDISDYLSLNSRQVDLTSYIESLTE